jgi:hypothetical protein
LSIFSHLKKSSFYQLYFIRLFGTSITSRGFCYYFIISSAKKARNILDNKKRNPKTGEIQVPKGLEEGLEAIKVQGEKCQQRFLVGADTGFEFDNTHSP